MMEGFNMKTLKDGIMTEMSIKDYIKYADSIIMDNVLYGYKMGLKESKIKTYERDARIELRQSIKAFYDNSDTIYVYDHTTQLYKETI